DIPDIFSDGSQENIKKAVEIIKNAISYTTYNSRYFNQGNLLTSTDKGSLKLLIEDRFTNRVDVNLLSSAFNKDRLNIEMDYVGVESLANTNTGRIIGFVCNDKTVGIYDTLQELRFSENVRALYRTYYLHIHQIHVITPYTTQFFIRI